MKKTFLKIFAVSLLSVLILPSFVFGYTLWYPEKNYNRTPSEIYPDTIYSPVSFNLMIDEDMPLSILGNPDYWGLSLETSIGLIEHPDIIASTTLEHTFVWDLPANLDCWEIIFTAYDELGNMIDDDAMEDGENEYAFHIVERPPTPPITAGFNDNVPDYDMASTTAHIGGLIEATGGLIWLFIGIPLGFMVIRKVIDLIKLKDKK